MKNGGFKRGKTKSIANPFCGLILVLIVSVSYLVSCRPAENEPVDDWATATFSLETPSRQYSGPLYAESEVRAVLISAVPDDFSLETNTSIPSASVYYDQQLMNIDNYTVKLAVPLGKPLRLVQNVYDLSYTLEEIVDNRPVSDSIGISDTIEVYGSGERISVPIELVDGPTVSGLSPEDATTDVAVSTDVTVTFSKTMDESSISVNTEDSACSGTIGLSDDDFDTCIPMVSPPATSNGQSFTITPASDLSYGTRYKTRVENSVLDTLGNCMTSDYTTSSGFTTIYRKTLTAFSFTAAANTGLSSDISAEISGADITVTVPGGTDVSSLVASFTTTGASVEVNGTEQVSGTTANDFSSPVTYQVIAGDGKTQDYTVTVTVAPSLLVAGSVIGSGGFLDVYLARFSLEDYSLLAETTVDFSKTQYGTSLEDQTLAMTLDDDGNIYIGGRTQYDTTDDYNFYAMVLKFNPSLEKTDHTLFSGYGGTTKWCQVYDLAVDNGYLYVSGLTNRGITTATQADGDRLLLRSDLDFTNIVTQHWDPGANDVAIIQTLSILSSGKLFTGGLTDQGTWTWDLSLRSSNLAEEDSVIVSAYNGYPIDSAINSNDEVYFIGYGNSGDHNWYIIKYDAALSIQSGFGTSGVVDIDHGNDDRGRAVVLNETADLIYVTGNKDNTVYQEWVVEALSASDGSRQAGTLANPYYSYSSTYGDAIPFDLSLSNDGKLVVVGTDTNSSGTQVSRMVWLNSADGSELNVWTDDVESRLYEVEMDE